MVLKTSLQLNLLCLKPDKRDLAGGMERKQIRKPELTAPKIHWLPNSWAFLDGSKVGFQESKNWWNRRTSWKTMPGHRGHLLWGNSKKDVTITKRIHRIHMDMVIWIGVVLIYQLELSYGHWLVLNVLIFIMLTYVNPLIFMMCFETKFPQRMDTGLTPGKMYGHVSFCWGILRLPAKFPLNQFWRI